MTHTSIVERVPLWYVENCTPLDPGTRMAAAISYSGIRMGAGFFFLNIQKTLDYNCSNIAVWLGLCTKICVQRHMGYVQAE